MPTARPPRVQRASTERGATPPSLARRGVRAHDAEDVRGGSRCGDSPTEARHPSGGRNTVIFDQWLRSVFIAAVGVLFAAVKALIARVKELENG